MDAVYSPEAPLSCRTATSFVVSYPTTPAEYALPLAMSLTLMAVAPLITWLLVSTSPEEVSTIPVPAASSLWNPRRVSMSTSPGSTLFAMDETTVGPDPVAVDEDG